MALELLGLFLLLLLNVLLFLANLVGEFLQLSSFFGFSLVNNPVGTFLLLTVLSQSLLLLFLLLLRDFHHVFVVAPLTVFQCFATSVLQVLLGSGAGNGFRSVFVRDLRALFNSLLCTPSMKCDLIVKIIGNLLHLFFSLPLGFPEIGLDFFAVQTALMSLSLPFLSRLSLLPFDVLHVLFPCMYSLAEGFHTLFLTLRVGHPNAFYGVLPVLSALRNVTFALCGHPHGSILRTELFV